MSAISVWAEIIGVRMLVLAAGVGSVCLLVLAGIIVIPLFTDVRIPNWTIYALAIVLALTLQIAFFCLGLIFITLKSRQNASFLPTRDYKSFVGRVEER